MPAIFVFSSIQCPFCFSDYVLRIRAVRYENPTDEDYDGGSCDPIFSDCDVYFHFCIRAVNLSPSNPDNCWDTITTSSSFESTNKTFPITGSLYPGANAQNPLTFSSNNAWPVSNHNDPSYSMYFYTLYYVFLGLISVASVQY